MEKFVHQQNLLLLRKQLATTQTQAQRLQLSSLMAEEEARAMRSASSAGFPPLSKKGPGRARRRDD